MIKLFVASIILSLAAVHAHADAPAQAATCVVCHGEGGVSTNGEWPSLAGQKQGYLRDQISAFRDGARVNMLMAPMVANLSDADIEVLASYYAGQPRAVASSGDASLLAQGQQRAAYCMACHGMQGVSANEEWPNLAGQQARYLQDQLMAFKNGSRKNAIMQNIVTAFDEEDFAALAAFFSQLGK